MEEYLSWDDREAHSSTWLSVTLSDPRSKSLIQDPSIDEMALPKAWELSTGFGRMDVSDFSSIGRRLQKPKAASEFHEGRFWGSGVHGLRRPDLGQTFKLGPINEWANLS